MPPEALKVRSIFQIWLSNNLPFLLHIMVASNLICPKLLWKYMEIISTSSKKFGECKRKTNKTKHGNKIPLFTLKVTSVGHNTLLTSLIKLLE